MNRIRLIVLQGNLGNAKLQGLYAQLLDSDATKYSVVLTMFYVVSANRPFPQYCII